MRQYESATSYSRKISHTHIRAQRSSSSSSQVVQAVLWWCREKSGPTSGDKAGSFLFGRLRLRSRPVRAVRSCLFGQGAGSLHLENFCFSRSLFHNLSTPYSLYSLSSLRPPRHETPKDSHSAQELSNFPVGPEMLLWSGRDDARRPHCNYDLRLGMICPACADRAYRCQSILPFPVSSFPACYCYRITFFAAANVSSDRATRLITSPTSLTGCAVGPLHHTQFSNQESRPAKFRGMVLYRRALAVVH